MKKVNVWKLGLTNFDTALKIQNALARKHLDAMSKGIDYDCDTLLLTEHKPIYTAGVRNDLPPDEQSRLKSLGADFQKTNRGGLLTFHGPGQLVAYPVINLKHFKTSVRWYVNNLEEIIINICDDLDINAARSEHTGVWVDDNKIASIGIHAARYVTTHGVALNCDNDLNWFKHIDPCGFTDKGVTSIVKETGSQFSVEKVTPMFLNKFKSVFNCEIEPIDNKLQEEILNTVYGSVMTSLGLKPTESSEEKVAEAV